LEKILNRTRSEDEKEAIMKDFPKPNCKVLSAPKLDDQVKDQLKKKGKDPTLEQRSPFSSCRSSFWM